MDNSSAAAAGYLVSVIIGAIMILAALVLMMIPYWRIVAKAGYSGWLSLLMLIPLVNIVVLFIFAFSDWPLEQRARNVGPVAP